MNDLPSYREQQGSDNRDFNFDALGAIFDGKCLAEVALPEYAISEIRTGQYTSEGRVWEGSFDVVEPADDGKAER